MSIRVKNFKSITLMVFLAISFFSCTKSQPLKLNNKISIFDANNDKNEPKIVATLGPSSSEVGVLEKMINAGLNMARINASHGSNEANQKLIENVRLASKKANKPVKILVDLQGPKIRVDKLPEPLVLKPGQEWVIGRAQDMQLFPEYTSSFIPTVYKKLANDAAVGENIFFDDGFLQAKAIEKITRDNRTVLKIIVVVGGLLKSNKGINLPGSPISAPSLTKKDELDLLFAISQKADAIGLSFVRTAADIEKVQAKIRAQGSNIPVVAKIETPEAVANLEEIVKVADGIMVARGDLAVEIGFEKVPSVQQRLICLANHYKKDIITATQMLESMITSTRPTRSEADNIAHAIWQGSDAVMLSGESAVGIDPVGAIAAMKLISSAAKESGINYAKSCPEIK